ncbi:acyl-CoA thioester hydrolase [Pseudomonas sp. PvP027]|uniref:acyl-CoA thioesterase n=1 Tax=Pseudomonas sp. PvP027 TaxID=2806587 RepID=UPI000473AC26|nr:acyl-CoA thioester hydrolase [Pseudomonas sp. PvP027]
MEHTYRGVVYPAQTDAMGHMTVQYYVAAFDQAFWHFISALGYNPAWRNTKGEGWADVKYVINYSSELKVGDLFSVRSRAVRVGNSSLVTHHDLLNIEGSICADIEMTSVYFNLAEREAMSIPDAIRLNANAAISKQQ